MNPLYYPTFPTKNVHYYRKNKVNGSYLAIYSLVEILGGNVVSEQGPIKSNDKVIKEDCDG